MTLRQHKTRLFELIERRFGFDVNFYSDSVSWMLFSHVGVVLRGLATTFLMARWLPKETLGQFRFLLAIFSLAGIFSLTGLNSSVVKGITKNDPIIGWLALRRILQFSPLGSLLLCLAALERYMHHEPTIALAMLATALIFPLYSIAGLYGPIMTGKEQIPRLAKTSLLNNILFTLCFLVVLLSSRNLLTLVFAYFGFDVLLRGFITWREFKHLPKHGDGSAHLRLGSHLTAIGAVQALATQLDQILIQRFAGYSVLADFNIATLIPEQLKDLAGSINNIVLQRFSKYRSSTSLLEQTRRHFWTVFNLSAVMILGYALTAPFVLPILFPKYGQVVWPSIVYAVGLLALASMVGLNFFQAHNQIGKLWKFHSFSSLMLIGGNLLLIPFFGSWGAIISKTANRLLSMFLSYPSLSDKGDASLDSKLDPTEKDYVSSTEQNTV